MADIKKGGAAPASGPASVRPAEPSPAGPRPEARVRLPFGPRGVEPDARERRDRQATEEQLLGDGRLGDPSVNSEELRALGSLPAGRHLMTLLARRRKDVARDQVIQEVAELLLGMDDGPWARRLLLQMADSGRIVDVYPLEVMRYLVEAHPGSVDRVEMGDVVLNKALLESQIHAVGGLIVLKVPLALKMKSFALEGGGTPGYILAPGPPAHYLLEVHEPGPFTLLVRGEVRRTSYIDRVCLQVEDPPESAP